MANFERGRPRSSANAIGRARELRQRQTEAERILWRNLRNRWLAKAKFRRQHPVGPYIVDFASDEHKLVIEVDGGQHSESVARARDLERTAWLEADGYTVLRVWNNEVVSNLEGVLEKIRMTLDAE